MLRFITALCSLFLVVGSAQAQQFYFGAPKGFTTVPPAQYDHKPRGKVRTLVVSYDEARRRCNSIGNNNVANRITMACSFPDGRGGGLIVVPRGGEYGVSHFEHRCLIRHEMGHINGWQGHAGERFC